MASSPRSTPNVPWSKVVSVPAVEQMPPLPLPAVAIPPLIPRRVSPINRIPIAEPPRNVKFVEWLHDQVTVVQETMPFMQLHDVQKHPILAAIALDKDMHSTVHPFDHGLPTNDLQFKCTVMKEKWLYVTLSFDTNLPTSVPLIRLTYDARRAKQHMELTVENAKMTKTSRMVEKSSVFTLAFDDTDEEEETMLSPVKHKHDLPFHWTKLWDKIEWLPHSRTSLADALHSMLDTLADEYNWDKGADTGVQCSAQTLAIIRLAKQKRVRLSASPMPSSSATVVPLSSVTVSVGSSHQLPQLQQPQQEQNGGVRNQQLYESLARPTQSYSREVMLRQESTDAQVRQQRQVNQQQQQVNQQMQQQVDQQMQQQVNQQMQQQVDQQMQHPPPGMHHQLPQTPYQESRTELQQPQQQHQQQQWSVEQQPPPGYTESYEQMSEPYYDAPQHQQYQQPHVQSLTSSEFRQPAEPYSDEKIYNMEFQTPSADYNGQGDAQYGPGAVCYPTNAQAPYESHSQNVVYYSTNQQPPMHQPANQQPPMHQPANQQPPMDGTADPFTYAKAGAVTPVNERVDNVMSAVLNRFGGKTYELHGTGTLSIYQEVRQCLDSRRPKYKGDYVLAHDKQSVQGYIWHQLCHNHLVKLEVNEITTRLYHTWTKRDTRMFQPDKKAAFLQYVTHVRQEYAAHLYKTEFLEHVRKTWCFADRPLPPRNARIRLLRVDVDTNAEGMACEVRLFIGGVPHAVTYVMRDRTAVGAPSKSAKDLSLVLEVVYNTESVPETDLANRHDAALIGRSCVKFDRVHVNGMVNEISHARFLQCLKRFYAPASKHVFYTSYFLFAVLQDTLREFSGMIHYGATIVRHRASMLENVAAAVFDRKRSGPRNFAEFLKQVQENNMIHIVVPYTYGRRTLAQLKIALKSDAAKGTPCFAKAQVRLTLSSEASNGCAVERTIPRFELVGKDCTAGHGGATTTARLEMKQRVRVILEAMNKELMMKEK